MPTTNESEQQKILDLGLERALSESDARAVANALRRGASPNSAWPRSSPFCLAINTGNEKIALLLHETGGLLRPYEAIEASPLARAARAALPLFFSRLLSEGEGLGKRSDLLGPLNFIIRDRLGKEWTDPAIQAWRMALQEHPSPESLLLGSGWGFFGNRPALLLPGAEPALIAWIERCRQSDLAWKTPKFSRELGLVTIKSVSMGSASAVQALLKALGECERPSKEEAKQFGLVLALSIGAAIEANRSPDVLFAACDAWMQLRQASRRGKRHPDSLLPLIWETWHDASFAQKQRSLSVFIRLKMPFSRYSSTDGAQIPWQNTLAALGSSPAHASHDDSVAKGKTSATALLAAGVFPHSSVFSDFPALLPLADALAKNAPHQKLAAGFSSADLAPIGALPPLSEPLQWLLNSLKAAQSQQMESRPVRPQRARFGF